MTISEISELSEHSEKPLSEISELFRTFSELFPNFFQTFSELFPNFLTQKQVFLTQKLKLNKLFLKFLKFTYIFE